jgi:hypothetical protein
MMLMISPEDFRQLSSACQQELLGLLTRSTTHATSPASFEDPPPDWEADEYLVEEDHTYLDTPADTPPRAVVPDSAEGAQKQVLDISLATARDLIANISDKSLTALTQFATGQPVELTSLIGAKAPYRDMNELKRSLVGAVNRRLRTVTDNRAAVLFASSRDRQRIHITARSAASLRQAMRLPEPLPDITYVDGAGHTLAPNNTGAQALKQCLHEAAMHMTLRPMEHRNHLLPAQIFQFLSERGFSLCCGKPITDDDGLKQHFAWVGQDQLPANIFDLIDPQGNVRISTDDGTLYLRVFVNHPECVGVLGTLASL